MVISEWTQTPYGNFILETDEGEPILISYRAPGTFNIMPDDPTTGETAMRFMNKWFILNGDFREQYKEAFPDPVRCLKVFEENKQYRSSWSTDGDVDLADVIDWYLKRLENLENGTL